MAINIYDWRSMTNAVTKVKTPVPFILDLFFGNKFNHPTDSFDWEEITASDRVAQFASADTHAPKSAKKKTRTTKKMTIPRTFEEKGFTAAQLARFKTQNDGIIYVGSAQDIVNQATSAILDEVADLKDRVLRRRELMAAEAIVAGQVTVTVDGNSYTADYGYQNTTHKVTLSGGSTWDQGTATILTNIRTWKQTIIKRTGYTRIACVMGETAAQYFINDAAVMKALNNLNYSVGRLDLNTLPTDRASRYIGTFEGIDFYVYAQTYTDANGSSADMFAANKVVMGAIGNNNNRLHLGPIVRMQPGGQTLTITNEMLLYPVVNANGTGVSWELDQKSIPAIHEPDAFFSATVA